MFHRTCMEKARKIIKQKIKLDKSLLTINPEKYYREFKKIKPMDFSLVLANEALVMFEGYRDSLLKSKDSLGAKYTHKVFLLDARSSSHEEYMNFIEKIGEKIKREETLLVKILGCCSCESFPGFREAVDLAYYTGKVTEIYDCGSSLLKVVTPFGVFDTEYKRIK